MSDLDCEIVGGDYAAAGRASRALKARLTSIGVDSAALRRALIAAYEAEANVVIHARHGRLRAYFGPGQLDVEIEDDGPGIPDIEAAMQEGFSTAPAEARALGFGAGMGLPNIRRSADRLSVQSTVGRGTRVSFSVRYRPQEGASTRGHSLRVDAAKCRRCLHCLRVCPTAAIRVRATGPELIEHRCVDCAECLAVCAPGALALRGADATPSPPREGTTLVVPRPLLHQFGPAVDAGGAHVALGRLGFASVATLGPWDDALALAVEAHAAAAPAPRPAIAPVCPAALELVAMRFPSLLPDVAPFLPAVEAARDELGARQPAAFVVLCPAQRTALTSAMGAARVEVLSPSWLFGELLPTLDRGRPHPPAPAERGSDLAPSVVTPRREAGEKPVEKPALVVTGLRSVARVLDFAEKGHLWDARVLELYACPGGCWGSPLLAEEPHVARFRAREPERERGGGVAVARTAPLAPRPGLRLDPDMMEAIRKLGRIDALVRDLPGRDCGSCGAPDCAAFAEDVIMGRARREACPSCAPAPTPTEGGEP